MEFMGFFFFILWENRVQKLCLSFFQDVFYKQKQPLKIICISIVGGMIGFSIYVKK